ncbi:ATP-binding cassette domain-containing protein [Corynebacterium uterequi]|uniref:ATP-binding cassette domain-containing protein n=1 Tax=Corynebacterium uterequi TaxID=1072256 RepID=UPI001EEEAB5F|nr:ATP-binding cassette domain-containing protein [Corynebacterium uterequi]
MITTLAALALAYLVAPLVALGTRVPWGRLGRILVRDDVTELLRLTLLAAVCSSVIVVVLGTPLALALHSYRRGAMLARVLVLLPLAMPPVVGGLALSALLGNRGALSGLLEAAGIRIAFAFPGVVAAHVFVALPFVVVAVDSALRQVDREVTASAASIGMSPWRVTSRITVPTIAPALATGAGLAFARSLGEFGTTITFAGSMPGVTRTMALAIYVERESDRDVAYALSAVLLLLATITLVVSALPAMWRRLPPSRPLPLEEMDAEALSELTRPVAAEDVVITSAGVRTEFPARRISAVVGPNGSGKSTLMGLMAGRLLAPDTQVSVGGRRVDGLPAHRRGVVLLTQRPGLPPIGTVSSAITLVTGDASRTRALLEAAGLGRLHDAPTLALSGGQAAQVALVRALAARPSVLVLDEPLAAVDVESAVRWRRVLSAASAHRTTVLVTHDGLDVAGMADRLVVLESGGVVAAGATLQLLAVPPTDFVAALTGLNRLEGLVDAVNGRIITATCGGLRVTGKASPAEHRLRPGDHVVVTLDPAGTAVQPPGVQPPSSVCNVWPGTVETISAVDVTSAKASVRLASGARLVVPVTAAAVVELGLEPGTRVDCFTKARAIAVHPHPTSIH